MCIVEFILKKCIFVIHNKEEKLWGLDLQKYFYPLNMQNREVTVPIVNSRRSGTVEQEAHELARLK